MADIFNGRYTADIEGDFVVFNIGMRINRVRAWRQWLPAARAMQPMLEALYRLSLIHISEPTRPY